MRPHQHYKAIFHQQVSALGATSILDVGCGRGEWVEALREAGIQAVGLDTSHSIKLSNPHIKHGRASALPFEDQSIDLVVSEFAAHHFENLAGHLSEAFRVARLGVAILDPWYDDSLASQRVARRMDEWMKRIDRAAGGVHHPVISAGQFVDALPDGIDVEVQVQHVLKLEPVPADTIEHWFESYAVKADTAGVSADCLDGRAELKADIARHGLTQDGAIIVTAMRSP
jgi:SAM-dependent methyltransferase